MKLRLVGMALFVLVALLGLNLIATGTARAQARAASVQMADDCAHTPTIDSLEACVKHAADQGFIDSQRVTHSLLAKLDKAKDALEDGHTKLAIHWLKRFIHEVRAQSGKHIVPEHAKHLEMHAQMVIQALEKEGN